MGLGVTSSQGRQKNITSPVMSKVLVLIRCTSTWPGMLLHGEEVALYHEPHGLAASQTVRGRSWSPGESLGPEDQRSPMESTPLIHQGG